MTLLVILSSCMLYCFSHVWISVTPWTVAHQAPLSMGFSRQEYWSGLPCPPSGHLPDPGIEPVSLKSPALAGGFFTTSASWKDLIIYTYIHTYMDFSVSSAGKESVCSAGDPGSILVLRSFPGEGISYPLQYSCLDNPHGQGSLEGYSLRGRKESDITERLSTAQHINIYIYIKYIYIYIYIYINNFN